MKNIFENAYFDKPYRTKDDRKAIYLGKNSAQNFHCLSVDDDKECTYHLYKNNGQVEYPFADGLDIVSEWHESIDEEKIIDELVSEIYDDSDDNDDDEPVYGIYPSNLKNIYRDGCIAGYRKAKLK